MANINKDVIKTTARMFACIFACLFIFLTGCSAPEPMPVITEVSEHADIQMLAGPITIIGEDTANDITSEWIPSAEFEDKTRWKSIVIHHSATEFGDVSYIDYLHKYRGYDGVGYDFVINNGLIKNSYGKDDGLVEVSYRWPKQTTGAHCRVEGDETNYWNEHAVGICLIGNFENTRPTAAQLDSLVTLIRFLQSRYNIDFDHIKGHCDIKPTKCPGKHFHFEELKRRLAE